jgi:hypothetical protein
VLSIQFDLILTVRLPIIKEAKIPGPIFIASLYVSTDILQVEVAQRREFGRVGDVWDVRDMIQQSRSLPRQRVVSLLDVFDPLRSLAIQLHLTSCITSYSCGPHSEPRLCDEVFDRLLERVVSAKRSLILRSSLVTDVHPFTPWFQHLVLVLPLNTPRRNGLQLTKNPAAGLPVPSSFSCLEPPRIRRVVAYSTRRPSLRAGPPEL